MARCLLYYRTLPPRGGKTDNGFSLDDKVFPKFNKSKGAKMLRVDLEAAEIDYEDEAGRFADFHSLRHSFISNVGKSGATVKEAQRLARHSTSALTLDVYTHIGLHDERRAVEKLPQLHNIDGKDAEKNQAVALKTGTDDKPVKAAQNSPRRLTPVMRPSLKYKITFFVFSYISTDIPST